MALELEVPVTARGAGTSVAGNAIGPGIGIVLYVGRHLNRVLGVTPNSRGQRKLYEVLPAGRAALVTWLGEYEAPERSRDALLVRLRAASVVGPGPLVEQMRLHRDAHAERHAEYLEIARRDFGDPHRDSSAQIQHMILLAGVGLEQYWMTWLSEAIELLSEVDRGDGPAPQVVIDQ